MVIGALLILLMALSVLVIDPILSSTGSGLVESLLLIAFWGLLLVGIALFCWGVWSLIVAVFARSDEGTGDPAGVGRRSGASSRLDEVRRMGADAVAAARAKASDSVRSALGRDSDERAAARSDITSFRKSVADQGDDEISIRPSSEAGRIPAAAVTPRVAAGAARGEIVANGHAGGGDPLEVAGRGLKSAGGQTGGDARQAPGPSLPSDLRLALRSMAWMAAAGGRLDDRKVAMIARLFRRATGRDIDPDDIRDVTAGITDMNRRFIEELAASRGGMSDQAKSLVVKASYMTLAADGQASFEEEQRIGDIAQALDMPYELASSAIRAADREMS
ncbi:MAG: hypothetical protein R3D33_15965 [Hyphomicrobiaceae bacterium]